MPRKGDVKPKLNSDRLYQAEVALQEIQAFLVSGGNFKPSALITPDPAEDLGI